MNQNRAFALGLICLLAVAGLVSMSAAQDKAATSEPAVVADPTSKPADAGAPRVAPAPAPAAPIATSAPAAVAPPATPAPEPVAAIKVEPGKVPYNIAVQALPAGVKAGDRVNVFAATDNTLKRVLDSVTVLAVGGKLPNPRAGEEGLTLVTIAETADKALDADIALAKAKDKVFFELAPAAAAPAGDVKPPTATPPTPVADTGTPAAKTPEPPKVKALKLDAFAHGRNYAVVPDQEIVVELKGSTATPWELTKIDGASLQQVGKVEFKPKSEGAKDGAYTATLKAGKEGKAVVQFQSLIEAGKKDKMEIKFTVTVAAAPAGGA